MNLFLLIFIYFLNKECQAQCQIDLIVSAKLDPQFNIPFIIGSYSIITLIFSVMNIGQDPAYRPVLKIPLNGEKLTKIPGNCAKVRLKHYEIYFVIVL